MSTAVPQERKLRKGLSIWQVFGLSIALMAPSMAANINPQGSAGAGRAVPLAFLFAGVGVLFVAYVFVRLTQYFNHAGSVFGFVGATMGPRAGVIAGWGLMGTYVSYAIVTSFASSIFLVGLLAKENIWSNPPTWAPFLFAAIEWLLILALAIRPAKSGTHFLLTVEGVTITLIVLITIVVLVKLIGGHGPQGQHFTMSVFSPAKGIGTKALALATVFGFLSFAGFEASATLGEEAKQPKRDIPRAILGTAIFGGFYFVIVTAVEVMGFGTTKAGLANFAASPSLLGDLGSTYVASWIGNLITLGTVVSAFGCALASTVGASRLLFALNRDSVGAPMLKRVSSKFDTPTGATVAIIILVAAVAWISALLGASAFQEFLWFGTVGTLIILVVYILATIGATNLVFIQKKVDVAQWQIILPIMALVILGATVYFNVVPYPTGSGKWLPLASAVWLLIAIVAVLAAPGIAKKAGERLTMDEDLVPMESAYAPESIHEGS